jgi:NADPH:quinone reductase-like Zn-dependent oxidoreductase
MKAITVEAFGGPEQLRWATVADPSPMAGEVIVAISLAGVGFVDVMARQGRYVFPKPGFIPGLEIAGEVVALGEGVDAVWLGRRVVAFPARGGGYAERIALKLRELIPLPPDIAPEEALAIGVNGLVAAFALDRAQVTAGDRVLIRGAGGGIGLMATQLAARQTPEVTATTSSAARGQRLAALGAATLWNRRTDPPLAPESFDIVIDTVGGPELSSFIETLRLNGRYVMAGGLGGAPNADFGMALMRRFHHSLSFAALSLNSISTEASARRLEPLLRALRQGEIAAAIDSTIPLAEAALAHRRLESGETFGKILLAATITGDHR